MAQRFTAPASFDKRDAAWNESVEATQKHIKYGAFLQSKGGKLLEGLNDIKDADHAEHWQNTFEKALTNIEKGIKIEREAREALMSLYQEQPKEQ